MKKFSILLVLILTTMFYGCSGESKAEIASSKDDDKGVPVTIKKVTNSSFQEYLNLTGIIKANSQVNLIAEESGILVKIVKDKGSYVQAGDVLGIIENKMTSANAAQALAMLKQAEINFNSSKVLYEKKAISENEYLTAGFSLDATKAAYDLANERKQKLTVNAPISGYVNARYIDLGGYVSPTAPLFEIVDNQKMKVSIGVAERFIRFIKPGSDIELKFDALPDLVINSKINFVAKSVNPSTRTFNIESSFLNPSGLLAPEMIANIRLLKLEHKNSIVVPIDAVIDSEAGRYVFIARENIARKKMVNIEAIQGGNVLVEGLSVDDQLVVMGQRSLTDGDTLNIIE